MDELWKEYNEKGTLEARERLIIEALPYIKATAYRLKVYAGNFQDVDDLISAGVIGLIDALEKYDPYKGVSFMHYARYRIRGSMLDEIRSTDWVPYSARLKERKLRKAMKECELSGQQSPDETDVAEAMGVSLDQYRSILMEVNRMTFTQLTEAIYNDGYISNNCETVLSAMPEAELLHAEMERLLGDAVKGLPEQERLVISLYYYEEMTMKEIGAVLEISESRVCQIHSRAVLHLYGRLKRMRSHIEI
jgi:RNA polymerase sigma factor for flagellar operon FliA